MVTWGFFLYTEKMQNAYEPAIGHYKQKYFIVRVKYSMLFSPHFWTFKSKILASIAVWTKIISIAFRLLLLLHFNSNGVCLLSFWLNRHPCRRAFWNFVNLINFNVHSQRPSFNVNTKKQGGLIPKVKWNFF